MTRYIDGTDLLNKYNSKNMTANEMYQALVEQPTADVVEIPCRCNECKSFVENKEALVTYCTRECKNLTVKPSDFCSYGRRK